MPAISTVCGAVEAGQATIVSGPFNWLAEAMGQTAAWMVESVWAALDTTTMVDLTGNAYRGVYNLVFGIAVVLMLLMFLLQVIGGMLRGEPKSLVRGVVGLGQGMVGSFVAVGLTATALEIVDRLALGVVAATGNTLEGMGERLAALVVGLAQVNTTAPGVSAILTIVLGGLAVTAAALVWFTMLVRKALLLVAVVMAPIALSGLSWKATRGWFARWGSFVAALVVSKLVMVVVFLVGTAQASSPIDGGLGGVADPLAGIVVMFIAAFSPYMAYKFIAFAGFDTHQSVSAEHEAKSAMRPVRMPRHVGPAAVRTVLHARGGNGTASGGAGATAPVAPPAGGPAPGGAGQAGGAGAAGGAAGPVAAGVMAAASAGPATGRTVAGAADGQTTAAAPPPTTPTGTATNPPTGGRTAPPSGPVTPPAHPPPADPRERG